MTNRTFPAGSLTWDGLPSKQSPHVQPDGTHDLWHRANTVEIAHDGPVIPLTRRVPTVVVAYVKPVGHDECVVTLEATSTGYQASGLVADHVTKSLVDALHLRLIESTAERVWELGCAVGHQQPGPFRSVSDTLTTPAGPGGRGRDMTDERIALAARAWRKAKAEGEPVKAEVAGALHVSESQAAVYIRRAKTLGLIPLTGSETNSARQEMPQDTAEAVAYILGAFGNPTPRKPADYPRRKEIQ